MKKQAGFTLIELVIVIVILGILAAFALPRFADLSTDARIASIKGAAGSVKAASAISHSKWLVEGGSISNDEITLEGVTIPMVNGYPDMYGIIKAAQVEDDYDTTTAGGTATVEIPDYSNCNVTYDEATDDGGTPPVVTAPEINVDTSGC